MRALFTALLLAAVVVSSPGRARAAALTEVPRALSRQGAIYVPAYSTLSAIAGLTKVNFAVTLSVRILRLRGRWRCAALPSSIRCRST